MVRLSDESLEWSIKHLARYGSSDFFPRAFEFDAISHDWPRVKRYIQSLDMEGYVPRSASVSLAPKANATFRIVHQLDPLDSIVYSATIFELCNNIEAYRVDRSRRIACSYRIDVGEDGSFFNSETSGWAEYIERINSLIREYPSGFVLLCDIADFYNQIYIHRVRNILSEAACPSGAAAFVEKFLMGINTQTSTGIPVGPAASIILAEAVMADIDKKVMQYTNDFVRWVDDIVVFFANESDAVRLLHDMTEYLYKNHRLVFAGNKTKVISVERYRDVYHRDEEKIEQELVMQRAEELAMQALGDARRDSSPYDFFYDIDAEDIYDATASVLQERRLSILGDVYYNIVEHYITTGDSDLQLVKHALRRCSRYRIRKIVPLIVENFKALLPVFREVVVYLNGVVNADVVTRHRREFASLITSFEMNFPYVNTWVSYLLQNVAFNAVGLPEGYSSIRTIRDKVLIARRKNDVTLVKEYKNIIDDFGPWDKRAILYSASVLSSDEACHWARVVSSRGDVLEKAMASYIIAKCSV